MELEMLYELCFNKKIVKIKTETFDIPNVRQLIDFEERVRRFIKEHEAVGMDLILDLTGLHFKKKIGGFPDRCQ